MNLKFFWLIMVIMFMALVGIVFIQWHFIARSVQLNAEQFDKHVVDALQQVAYKIEKQEDLQAARYFSNGWSYQEFERDTLGNFTHLWISEQVIQDDKTLKRKMDANQFKLALYEQPLEKRLNLVQLDKELKEELAEHTIKLPFNYGVYSNFGRKIIAYNNHFLSEGDNPDIYTNILKSPYHVSLLTSDPSLPLPPGSLYIYFPNKNNYVWGSAGDSVFLSAFFVMLVLGCFGYTVYVVLKQKKLSEMKTDFVNNMTHEFKTPIATISLATDTILSASVIGNPEKIRHMAGIISQENKRMNGQVEKVLQMAQLERDAIHLSLSEVNLHELIEQAVENISLQVHKREGTVSSRLMAKNPVVEGDQNHIANILNNLLDNANKYSPEKPTITVSTASKNNGVEVTVTDKGIGIGKEARKQIFDKFYRVHTGNVHNIKGFGLGLSYVKAMVLAHRGTIDLKSELGKGSSFTVFFPYQVTENSLL